MKSWGAGGGNANYPIRPPSGGGAPLPPASQPSRGGRGGGGGGRPRRPQNQPRARNLRAASDLQKDAEAFRLLWKPRIARGEIDLEPAVAAWRQEIGGLVAQSANATDADIAALDAYTERGVLDLVAASEKTQFDARRKRTANAEAAVLSAQYVSASALLEDLDDEFLVELENGSPDAALQKLESELHEVGGVVSELDEGDRERLIKRADAIRNEARIKAATEIEERATATIEDGANQLRARALARFGRGGATDESIDGVIDAATDERALTDLQFTAQNHWRLLSQLIAVEKITPAAAQQSQDKFIAEMAQGMIWREVMHAVNSEVDDGVIFDWDQFVADAKLLVNNDDRFFRQASGTRRGLDQ